MTRAIAPITRDASARQPSRRARIDFEDDVDFDFLDEIQEDATLRLLRADMGREVIPRDAWFDAC